MGRYGTDRAVFEYGWFLCPNGNMKGFQIWDFEGSYEFEFLDEGDYDVYESSSEVRASYKSTVVRPSEIA